MFHSSPVRWSSPPRLSRVNQQEVTVMKRAVALLIVCFASAFSQTEKGAITGPVTDAAGAVIPEARVTVTNVETNVSQVLSTNAEGQYEAPFLSPGRYNVTVI